MKPNESQVRSVVRTVWSTQLGLDIRDADGVDRPAGDTMTAAIHVSGDFRGSVRLDCSRALLRRATAIMFDLPEAELDDDDERDVIGELTNVVAGNIKALIPGNSSISLPTIIDGTDYRVSTVDVRSSDTYHFSLDGESLAVTVIEHGA